METKPPAKFASSTSILFRLSWPLEFKKPLERVTSLMAESRTATENGSPLTFDWLMSEAPGVVTCYCVKTENFGEVQELNGLDVVSSGNRLQLTVKTASVTVTVVVSVPVLPLPIAVVV